MVNCAVTNCVNRSSRKTAQQIQLESRGKITFHRFPKDAEIRNKWLNNVGLSEASLLPASYVCSAHFTPNMFDRSSLNRIKLIPGAIPHCSTMLLNIESKEVPNDDSRNDKKKATILSKQHYIGVTPTDCYNRNQTTFSMKQPSINAAPANISKEVYVASTSNTEQNPCSTQTDRSTSVSPDHFHSPNRVQYADKSTSVSPKLHFNSPRKCRLRNMLRQQSKDHAQELKLLKQNNQRKKAKIESLQHILQELRSTNLLEEQDLDVLQNIGGSNKDLLTRIIKKCNKNSLPKTYSAELRKFSLTLHYYSPRAYEYVRENFDSCLPHPKTLSRWYRSVDGDPGFNSEAFACIKERSKSVTYPLIGTLIFDEMSIKQHIEYDGKKFCGYTDMGKDIECESQTVAKDGLVFLFVCMNGSWKIPVGYFLVNGMNAEQKSNLVLRCIEMLHEDGCTTVNCLIFDGAPVNFAMAKRLGCNLNDPNILQPWFQHPVTKEQIYVFPDPCHMIKLVRNSLGELKCLTNSAGQHILWNFIEVLHETQEQEGLHLGNKLRQAHINYRMQKMKVRFATQVFSKSVADALEVCDIQLGLTKFKNCSATCEFIRVFNDLFDIFNSKNLRANGYKKAINQDNSNFIIEKMKETKKYILSLKVADRRIVASRNRTGFLGFLMCIESLTAFFEETCIQKQLLRYIPTYKISQDHLELFFECLRARGGHNNNPTVRQFKAAYKKILVHTELRESSTGNCIALESISILHVSSRINSADIINSSTPATRMIEDSSSHINITDHSCVPDIRVLSEFSEQIITYIAGFVVKQFKNHLNCMECINALCADFNCLRHSLHKKIAVAYHFLHLMYTKFAKFARE